MGNWLNNWVIYIASCLVILYTFLLPSFGALDKALTTPENFFNLALLLGLSYLATRLSMAMLAVNLKRKVSLLILMYLGIVIGAFVFQYFDIRIDIHGNRRLYSLLLTKVFVGSYIATALTAVFLAGKRTARRKNN